MKFVSPEYLAELEQIEVAEFEEFEYVVLKVYEEITSEEMPLIEGTNPCQPVGENWKEEELKILFPKLVKKYW